MATDTNPPERRASVTLATFPDGSTLLRYVQGTYWHIHPPAAGIPARRVSFTDAVAMAIDKNARIPEWSPGGGRFYEGIVRERIRTDQRTRE